MGVLKTIGEILKFVSIEVIPFANLIVTSINNWKKKRKMNKNFNFWTTKNLYVNINTGEIIENFNVNDFVIINKKKFYDREKKIVRCTNECIEQRQLKLF